MSGPWCAHQKVVRKDNSTGGLVTREWWECADGCGKTFTPEAPPPSPQPQEATVKVQLECQGCEAPIETGNFCSVCAGELAKFKEPAAPLDSLSDAMPQEDTVAARSWHKVHGRPDVLGVRTLVGGQREYLMHNEALSQPYYVVIEECK